MRVSSFSRSIEQPRRKLKLWHFTVVVLLASIVFGGIKALTRGSSPSDLEALVAFACLWVLFSLFLYFIHLGAKLGNRATQGVKDWGVTRGGVVGFGVWVLGIGMNLAVVLGAMGLGVFLIVSLVRLLIQLAG